MKEDNLDIKYQKHERRDFVPRIQCDIRDKNVYLKTIKTLKKFASFFDNNENYNIEIRMEDSDINKYIFLSFEDLIEQLAERDTPSKITPTERIFRYNSFVITIKEVNGKELYILGEKGVSDIMHYEYYRNSKDDDVIKRLFEIQPMLDY